jgi:hypothetical protein
LKSPDEPLATAVQAGVLAGTLDIAWAIGSGIVAGRAAERTLQSVASGLLGAAAFQRGWPAAALGLALHFAIALVAAAVYRAAAGRLAPLRELPLVAGPVFGACVYLSMHLVVVPLSAAPFRLPLGVTGLSVHLLLVGLPIALVVRRRMHPDRPA